MIVIFQFQTNKTEKIWYQQNFTSGRRKISPDGRCEEKQEGINHTKSEK